MSTSMLRLPPLVMLAAVLGVALSGCAGSADFPAFDRERTADDELPDGATIDTELYDLSSTRDAGSTDDADFFLVKSEQLDAGPCLVIVADGEAAVGCAGSGLVLEFGGVKAALAPKGDPVGEYKGWTRISDYVAVEDH
jgi:hypothetical protein